ncbi:MAG TPA: serine/threonine-protein kinase [Polyangiaceae bacterium]|nr:serine/threonine-protein kinase [Polyangiaceae bacterium]
MPAPPTTTSPSERSPLGPGTIVGGKYRIDGFLGTGGMGVVLSARHLELDAPVAIKIVRDDFAANEAVVSRLLFEARAVARMQSVHVVRVLDVARLPNGAPYVVMEKLRGADLAALLEQRGSLPVAEAIGYLLQACEGLIEAHSLGIVHRDLKPENLFLAVTPEGMVLKILDFGISKDLSSAVREGRRTTLTKGGAAIGSPSYMAPEQIRAEPNLDARADIWSLGTILFELLTGRCPFEAETVAAMYQKVLNEDPSSLLDFLPDAPRELNTIIRLCLQKDANDRFQTVQELVCALRGLSRPIVSPRARLESGIALVTAPRAPAPSVSVPVKLGLFATTTVLIAASVAFWHLQFRNAPAREALSLRPSTAAQRSDARVTPPPVASLDATSVSSSERPLLQPELPVSKPEPPITRPAAPTPKPEPPARPAPWPATRKPIPFSAGMRYGL